MRQRCSWAVAALLILTSVPAIAAQPERIAADTEVKVFDVPDKAAQKAELHLSLMASEPARGLGRTLEIRLSPAEKIAAAAQVVDTRLRVGIDKPVGMKLGPASKFGDVETGADGSVVWTGRIVSPDARGIRLHFSPFNLPESAELYVYSADGEAYGPYTGSGPVDDRQLWTNTILGPEVRLQLRVAPEEVAHTRLVLANLGHLGEGLPMATEAFCSGNAACVVNASCASIPGAIQPAKEAVASILFASGASYYICSGGLVADSDSASTVPYFLTANHCISSSGEASSVETYFDYVTTCSSPNCTQPYFSGADSVGAQIVASNRTGDYTLLRLSSIPSAGTLVFLGWNATAIANSNGADLFRLSHPSGSPQAYSTHDVDTSKPTCTSWPRGNWIYSRDTFGATEGGSSGSPVLNSAGQIVGQLSGACGYNVNDNCDAQSNATVDGAFASYYNQVSPFLAGGGSQCEPAGSSCSANAECCSGNCKGKPGRKTCK